MRITRACDYAFRAMLYLAASPTKSVETARVARAVDVPPVYLRKVLQALARAGLVKTTAGSGGGVTLAMPPDQITLMRIVEAVEGPLVLSDCIADKSACARGLSCRVQSCLSDIQESLRREFASRTLADLM